MKGQFDPKLRGCPFAQLPGDPALIDVEILKFWARPIGKGNTTWTASIRLPDGKTKQVSAHYVRVSA